MGYLGDASGFLTGSGSWGFGIRRGFSDCYVIVVLLGIIRFYPYAVGHLCLQTFVNSIVYGLSGTECI